MIRRMENRSGIGAAPEGDSGAMPPDQVTRPHQLASGDGAMPATAVTGEIRLYRVIQGRDGGNQQCEQPDDADEAGKSEASPWHA